MLKGVKAQTLFVAVNFLTVSYILKIQCKDQWFILSIGVLINWCINEYKIVPHPILKPNIVTKSWRHPILINSLYILLTFFLLIKYITVTTSFPKLYKIKYINFKVAIKLYTINIIKRKIIFIIKYLLKNFKEFKYCIMCEQSYKSNENIK